MNHAKKTRRYATRHLVTEETSRAWANSSGRSGRFVGAGRWAGWLGKAGAAAGSLLTLGKAYFGAASISRI